MSAMDRTRLSVVVLALAFALALALRLQAISEKTTVTHDEGITYLAATGHQAEFTDLYYSHHSPYGEWVDAAAWKRFLERDRFWCFRTIARDIAATDIHPPLYFWMLHVWLWVVGVHVWSAVSMNLLITLAMMVALYRFARHVLGDRLGAAVVVFTWAVSPHIMEESLEGRAYGLLALFALLLVWRVVVVVETGRVRPRDAAVIVVSTALGALTHYHFALAAAGAGLYAAYRLLPRIHDWRPFAAIAASVAAGYALFFAAHPTFYHSFSLQQSQSQPFDPSALAARAQKCIAAIAEYAIHPRAGSVVLTALVLILVAIVWRLLRNRPAAGSTGGDREGSVIYFFIWFSACIIALYMSFISPVHAMGPKYLSMAWPFFVFIPVLFVRSLPVRSRVPLLVLLCAWQLAYATGAAALTRFHERHHVSQRAILAGADRVLVDTVTRGVLPRVLFNVPDTMPVYAAMQDHIVAHPEEWSPGIEPGTVYVSHAGYGNSEEARDDILLIIEAGHAVIREDGGLTGIPCFLIQ